ncbi:hypothetical protein X797_000282 [Metarhizium robertsii]|uniref:Uncharacterized protein n=2 Tax=Metarhizium robertsii TaxID=568076 RepID=E9ENV4_METRA|nr:uncharacterized protein MAA_01963 [Metarhizium robertsii ARSEF 23]EFZ02381.1 hypothetical protein MAA_01963 [Metarhizium robertsii ARSEF 23]EXV05567.1 hypothetical protein X797_000282 [Metarhizium robertsii]
MSQPGDADWKWFPNVKAGWSLDVVNLLVVIGESSIAEHSQAITASLPGMLPRILPAPQALLKPSRPTRMPETHARMTGVYSGTTLESVGFFANIITPLDQLHAFSFKVLDIKHAVCPVERVPREAVGGVPAALAAMRRMLRRLKEAKGHEGDEEEKPAEQGLSSSPREQDEEAAAGAQQDKSSCNGATSTGLPRRQLTVQFADKTLDNMEDPDCPPGHSLTRRRSTARERAQDLLTSPTVAVGSNRPAVPAKLFSPIHILSIFSCALSIGLIVMAAVCQDGTAILAITLISLASTVVGYASFWRPILMKRKHTNEVPRGDVLIRTREGAFVLVRCSEEVARELYSGTEECEYYVGGNTYRALMALGTMLLMVSVVLLGNCTWDLKVFIGASYIVLNGLYWGLGMIPRSYFWDLSRYEWHDVTPPDAARAHLVTNELDQREGHPSFTRTLWYAIRETELTGWVERSGAAPSTHQWKKWLREAEQAAVEGNRKWPAVARKDIILKENLKAGRVFDQAAQHAPATEVRPPPDSGNRWTKDGTF